MEKLNLKNSERLSFEFLNKYNANGLFNMFKDDPSAYVSEDFKDLNKAINYAKRPAQYGKYFGYDILINNLKIAKPIGILHIFDTTTETFNNNHKKCTIGFAICSHQRGKYYMLETLKAAIPDLLQTFDQILCYTNHTNLPTIKLLQKIGFEGVREEYVNDKQYCYFEFRKGKC